MLYRYILYNESFLGMDGDFFLSFRSMIDIFSLISLKEEISRRL